MVLGGSRERYVAMETWVAVSCWLMRMCKPDSPDELCLMRAARTRWPRPRSKRGGATRASVATGRVRPRDGCWRLTEN